jgi:hypothetical protein
VVDISLATRGHIHLRVSTLGPKEIINWGRRLLYVVLFLSFLVAFGNYDKTFTFTFVGSVVALIVPVLCLLEDNEDEFIRDGS